LTFTINIRLLLILIAAFILATIVGTVSHECGHYIVAKAMGFDAGIGYAYTWLTDENHPITPQQLFWFTLGGPLLTMLTGTTGFCLLLRSRKTSAKLSPGQWVFIFLSLFWLRQVANLAMWTYSGLVNGDFSGTSDEVKLSRYLHWPSPTIMIAIALPGVCILAYIIFRVIPERLRFTFILGGCIGGVTGFLLWITYLGS